MKKLFKSKKGFTLMEMLIVVAIIVILVAISIPTFSASLGEARAATDDANLRAAKAQAVSEGMLGDGSIEAGWVYNIDTGKFEAYDATKHKAYGASSANSANVIIYYEDAEGNPMAGWAAPGSTSVTP